MSTVCIVTALPAESRVFIDALKLRHVQDCGWRLYGGDDCVLLQTGVGKLKSAAAVSALLHSRPDIHALINAGVAGGTAPMGTVLMAHQVHDVGSGADWFPHLPPQRIVNSLPTACVSTVDKPDSDYRENTLFEMEAAGIFSAASQYLSTDAMQAVKVISDNAESPYQSFSPTEATRLMHNAVPLVTALVQWYQQPENTSVLHQEIEQRLQHILTHVHHTASEQHQLRRLLYQHLSLTNSHPNSDNLIKLGKARSIRHLLQNTVSETPLYYGEQL